MLFHLTCAHSNGEIKRYTYRLSEQGSLGYISVGRFLSAVPELNGISQVLFPILSRQPPPLFVLGITLIVYLFRRRAFHGSYQGHIAHWHNRDFVMP